MEPVFTHNNFKITIKDNNKVDLTPFLSIYGVFTIYVQSVNTYGACAIFSVAKSSGGEYWNVNRLTNSSGNKKETLMLDTVNGKLHMCQLNSGDPKREFTYNVVIRGLM